jgi:hypothetical protein
MYSNAFCPISEKRVNSSVIRAHAIINVAILLVFLYTQNIFIALFLFADFFVRVLNFPNLSIVGIAARSLVNILGVKGKLENAGPKLFAARIGLLFTVIISTALLTGFTGIALGAAAVLAFFSFLEGAFGICVACMIYPYFHRLTYS